MFQLTISLDLRDIKNWQIFIHDSGMMVPGVLGKFGRAYDQLTSVNKNDITKNSDITTPKIRKHFAFVVSKVLTSYMPGLSVIGL